jgi:hypothetical protein
MLGPSTGILRCFKRSEDYASGVDLVFIMLSGVLSDVEAHGKTEILKEPNPVVDRASARSIRRVRPFVKKALAFSPLSLRIETGRPRPSITRISIRVRRRLGMDVSTSSIRHSRV